MKIAYICEHNPHNKLARSGVPHSIFEELKKYHEVEWVEPKIYGIRKILLTLYKILFIPLKWFGYTRSDRNYFYHWLFKKDIQNKLDKGGYDSIFTMGTQYIGCLDVNIPIYYRADAIYHSCPGYYDFTTPKFMIRWGVKYEEIAMSKTTIFFAASEWIRYEVKRYCPQFIDKVIFVETGANLEKESIKLRQRKYEKDEPLNALFVGFDVKRKGVDVAFKTVELLNRQYGINAKLTIMGGKPDDEILASPYVNYVGMKNKNKPEQYAEFYDEYYKADIFLFPTRAEFHGIVNCEAAAYGLPIFSYDTGGVSSYVINNENGYTLDLSQGAEDYAKLINDCIVDGRMDRFSKRSRELFETRFNWVVWGEKVNKIINKKYE